MTIISDLINSTTVKDGRSKLKQFFGSKGDCRKLRCRRIRTEGEICETIIDRDVVLFYPPSVILIDSYDWCK